MPDVVVTRETETRTRGSTQDLVGLVALVRTLADSFGSAGDLYRKLKKQSKFVKEDVKERITDEIKDHIDEHRHKYARRHRRGSHSDDEQGRDRSARRQSRSRSRKRRDESQDSDEESIVTSSSLVRAEFDRGAHYIGEKYAIGDLITRNQLQSQIIALQQTLLHIYEDIIWNENNSHRHGPSFHLRQLVQTARAARSASIEALALQYQRMLPSSEHREHVVLSGSFPTSPTAHSREIVTREARLKTGSVDRDHDGGNRHLVNLVERTTISKPKVEVNTASSSSASMSTKSVKAMPIVTPTSSRRPNSDRLYCVYAHDLQRSHALPLTNNFKAGGDNLCPFCHAHVPTRPNKAWEIVKEDKKGVERTFLVGARFMVKCHREGGGFACSLCTEYRDADTVCSEVRALVDHMWKEHSCTELEHDDNIGEET